MRECRPIAKDLAGRHFADEEFVIATEVAGAEQSAFEVAERVGKDRDPAGRLSRGDVVEGINALGDAAGVLLHQRRVFLRDDRNREPFVQADRMTDRAVARDRDAERGRLEARLLNPGDHHRLPRHATIGDGRENKHAARHAAECSTDSVL